MFHVPRYIQFVFEDCNYNASSSPAFWTCILRQVPSYIFHFSLHRQSLAVIQSAYIIVYSFFPFTAVLSINLPFFLLKPQNLYFWSKQIEVLLITAWYYVHRYVYHILCFQEFIIRGINSTCQVFWIPTEYIQNKLYPSNQHLRFSLHIALMISAPWLPADYQRDC